METMDAVVLARLLEPPPPESNDPTAPQPKGKFAVVDRLKGEAHVAKDAKIEILYYGDAPVGTIFLAMGVLEGDPGSKQEMIWSTPLKTSEKARAYISQLPQLPAGGATRLQFFQRHLEDAEELLARDAYDEFARAPYQDVIDLKPHMNHDQLVSWVKNEEIPASRRRLYLTMLGVCGSTDDLPFLEEMIRHGERSRRAGLDALLACYLTLKGESGLALVDELYFVQKAEYSDVNSAIMALRFHGTEANIISTKKIIPLFRRLLARPELADLIIPDLARWEDWESLDTLVALFKSANTKSSWVREPIINFVRVCPLPEAREKFRELEQIDPAAVKRANKFLPFGPPQPPPEEKQTSVIPPPLNAGSMASAATTTQVTALKPAVATANAGARRAAAVATKSPPPPNLTALWSVCASVVAVLFAVQWSLLTRSGKL
jgi:hypothetical protein